MDTDTITIRVAPAIARLFNSASEEQQRKLEVLVNLRLLEVAQQDIPLEDIMQEISTPTEEHSLTLATLQERFQSGR